MTVSTHATKKRQRVLALAAHILKKRGKGCSESRQCETSAIKEKLGSFPEEAVTELRTKDGLASCIC